MGVYDGAEQALVTTWIRGRLASVSADLEAINTGMPDRVFEDFAPYNYAVYPFIIIQCQSPPRAIRGVGVSTVMVDTLYVVKAVAQVDSYGPLAPVASVIKRALTTPTGGLVADGNVFTSIHEEQFALVEIDGGKQYRHFGGLFKIQAQG